MKRLVAFFIGSLLIFLLILSVLNLALFLEAAQCAEAGVAAINGVFFLDDLFALLRRAFLFIGILFLVHFALSAAIAGVYWFCWRPARRKPDESAEENAATSAPAIPENAGAPRNPLFRETSRTLSPFFAALFALVVLSPVLTRGIGKTYDELTSFLEEKITSPLAASAMESLDSEEEPQDPNAFLREPPAAEPELTEAATPEDAAEEPAE